MQQRKIGKSELWVGPWALGGNVFGFTVDEQSSFRLLDAFTDAGFNLIDTADSYSNWAPGNQGGESETIIGNWLKRSGKRPEVVLATKVGSKLSEDRKGLSKKHILQSIEGSLRRLQTDYVDLYQSHFDDPETPVEETLEAYDQLIRAGKVRYIGASNLKAGRLLESLQASEAQGYARYESLQPHYNLIERAGYEAEYAGLVEKHQLGVLPYFALASGFLTGKYRSGKDFSKSVRGEDAAKYLNERGFRILHALDTVAGESGATVAQVALAWLVSRPGISAAIASATTVEQVADLSRAMELRLSAEALRVLTEASA